MRPNDTNTMPAFSVNVVAVASAAAMFAAFFAACGVFQYVWNTQYGYGYSAFGTSLLDYVLGKAYDLGDTADDLLFVVVTRFVMAFGCLWLPIAGGFVGLGTLFSRRAVPPQPASSTPSTPSVASAPSEPIS